jgi:hypothetical protein
MLGHKCGASTKRYAKLLTETLKEVWGDQKTVSKGTVRELSLKGKPKPKTIMDTE